MLRLQQLNIKTLSVVFIGASLLLRLFYISANDLLAEEAYYWNYAKHLDFSYLDHPPMVALLIKISTIIWGTSEFSVRLPTLFCWLLIIFFNFKLTNLIKLGEGIYAIMLLAILPFFFLSSLAITPDQPLLVCWSAALYCLYRALILTERQYWYLTGIWLGLGMLSKYTIILLGPAILLYLSIVPMQRLWFTRKEPYICLLIVIIMFLPVIYWNANHEWVSFTFQGTRRLKANDSFSFHYFIGLILLFLMPFGIIGFGKLWQKNSLNIPNLPANTKNFLKIFTLVPLIIFGWFSLYHDLRFNWIGPGFLALVPWLAIIIASTKGNTKQRHYFLNICSNWQLTGIVLLVCYASIIFSTIFGKPELLNKKFLVKFISWEDLTKKFVNIAQQIEISTNSIPIFVPLDLYNLSSELSFYQTKLLTHYPSTKVYPIYGRHIFGAESLMYKYWSSKSKLTGRTLILISPDLNDFNNSELKKRVIDKSPLRMLWSQNQGHNAQIRPYYYKIAQILPN